MSEYKWQEPNRRLIQIREKEPISWLKDFSVLAFYEQDYSPEEIDQIKKIGTSKQTLWRELPVEGSEISFAFKTSDIKSNKNRTAFDIFLNENIHNPEFQDKYVVFVNEQFEGTADNEVELVKKIHDKYGNVDMYVGRISFKKSKGMIESPEI